MLKKRKGHRSDAARAVVLEKGEEIRWCNQNQPPSLAHSEVQGDLPETPCKTAEGKPMELEREPHNQVIFTGISVNLSYKLAGQPWASQSLSLPGILTWVLLL